MSSYNTVKVGLKVGSAVDRTIPLPLQPHIHATQWSSFCDQVDAVLQDLSRSIRMPIALMIGGTVVGFLLFGLGGYLSTQTFSFSPLIPVAIIVFMGSPVAGIWWMRKITTKFTADIQQVCENAQFRNVTVHYKEETVGYAYYGSYHHRRYGSTNSYLEFICGTPVAVADAEPVYAYAEAEIPVYGGNNSEKKSGFTSSTAVGVPMGSTDAPPPPSAPTQLSAKERLQALEGIRDQLTEQEYNEKRQDILRSI